MPQNIFLGDAARFYDAFCSGARHGDPAFIDESVALLAELAAGGSALEFGIGTGRVAVPLRARNVDVHGIEISEDMAAEVHAKSGGEDIPITLGDFAVTRADGEFTLVYAVYHTLGCLLTQAEQVACFRNAAAHLKPGGLFLVEFGVPQLRRMQRGENSYLSCTTDDYVAFERYDFVQQRMVSTEHWFLGERRITQFEIEYRYAWPSELDLMAELAGLRLRDRWADWSRSPFTNESEDHISVWEKP